MNKNPERALKTPAAGLRPYLVTAAVIVLSYILFSLILGVGESVARALMISGVLLCAVFFVVGCVSKRGASKTEALITALIAAGMVMRVGYMLYTSFTQRGHDIGAFDKTGHFAYMYQLFSAGTLPQSNEYQFYHPPFAHIVQALVVKVFSWFQPGADLTALFQAAKIVPCFASCALLVVVRSLCRETKLSGRATALAIAVVAFQPTFYIFSASVNNDPLMLLFFMIAVLYTIRWYDSPTMKNILVIALSIGLSMMTKLSGGMAALFTAPVFLMVLAKRWREKNAGAIFGQFAAFAGVCVPLGLWYPVRNLLRFDQAIGHVFTLSPASELYSGDYSFAQRFLSFPAGHLINPLYCEPYGDYNLWLYTLKCSVFGEFKFDWPEALAALLIVANLIVILVSLAAMVYVMLRCRETNKFIRFGLFWIWAVQLASFVLFNLQFPFGCTMDFRYIVPTAIVGAIYTGVALDHIKNKHKFASDALFIAGCAAIALFGVASVLFYAA
jgi:hypothetical protein